MFLLQWLTRGEKGTSRFSRSPCSQSGQGAGRAAPHGCAEALAAPRCRCGWSPPFPSGPSALALRAPPSFALLCWVSPQGRKHVAFFHLLESNCSSSSVTSLPSFLYPPFSSPLREILWKALLDSCLCLLVQSLSSYAVGFAPLLPRHTYSLIKVFQGPPPPSHPHSLLNTAVFREISFPQTAPQSAGSSHPSPDFPASSDSVSLTLMAPECGSPTGTLPWAPSLHGEALTCPDPTLDLPSPKLACPGFPHLSKWYSPCVPLLKSQTAASLLSSWHVMLDS